MNEIVYVVLHQDRHADAMTEVFKDEVKAVEHARRLAKECCRWPEDYDETEVEGWLFHAVYSSESDYVRVTEEELQ